ncbi:MAG: hypothetical protein ACXVAL_15155 [Vulcanimicrobiaceae bacterium]
MTIQSTLAHRFGDIITIRPSGSDGLSRLARVPVPAAVIKVQ